MFNISEMAIVLKEKDDDELKFSATCGYHCCCIVFNRILTCNTMYNQCKIVYKTKVCSTILYSNKLQCAVTDTNTLKQISFCFLYYSGNKEKAWDLGGMGKTT